MAARLRSRGPAPGYSWPRGAELVAVSGAAVLRLGLELALRAAARGRSTRSPNSRTFAARWGRWRWWSGQPHDAAAEHVRHGFTDAVALAVAPSGVTVNTISPGYIGTKMVMAIPKEVLDSKIVPQIPMGRLGKPEEVAGLVAYLASDEAAFLTGANIAINGGQHMF